MASLANGQSTIKNHSKSKDSKVLVRTLRKLGIKIIEKNDQLIITGNEGKFKSFNGILDVGEAGTALRFLTSLIILIPGRVVFHGSKRLMKRPIGELKEALKKVKTGEVSIKGDTSSQFISSLLMIAPVLDKDLVINITGRRISNSYIDMTIDLMKKFGVKVKKINSSKFIIKKQSYKSINYIVETDLSGASYFFAVAAITGKAIKVKNINFNSPQGDLLFPNLLKKMGCQVRKNIRERSLEVIGPKILKGINADMINMPDTAQTLSVVAAFARGNTKITGLSTLKLKETDRLLALKKELNKMKIKSVVTDDSIMIVGGKPKKAIINTYGDHRMAMAFAVAKSSIPELIIKNPEVVKKSFPEFWKIFNNLTSSF
jgi:3-phosphoshikimate 1-carboxyvinyltransferase